MTWVFLSHELDTKTPAYGGGRGLKVLKSQKISRTHTSRSQRWELGNHLGTHMDFPAHFVPRGKNLSAYSAPAFIFNRVALCEVQVRPSQLILPRHLVWPSRWTRAELLLIKTGFEKFRGSEKYILRGPGLHPDTCNEIRKRAPHLRAIGFDFISLTAFAHREEGREAHRILLGQNGLFILEDMSLAHLKRAPKQAVVAPLRVRGTDGAPITVFAKS